MHFHHFCDFSVSSAASFSQSSVFHVHHFPDCSVSYVPSVPEKSVCHFQDFGIHIPSFPDFSVVLPFWPVGTSLIQASLLQRLKPNSMCCLELFPDVRSFLFFLFSYFRKFSSSIVHHFRLFIFVHFRIIPSCCRFASQLFFSGYSITSGNMSEGFYFSCSIILANFRHSYFILCGLLCISEKIRLASSSCPNPSFPHVSCCVF